MGEINLGMNNSKHNVRWVSTKYVLRKLIATRWENVEAKLENSQITSDNVCFNQSIRGGGDIIK